MDLPDEVDPVDFLGLNCARIPVRRSGARRRVVNRLVQQTYYCGFLTHLEGDALGPWFLEFECTDALWFLDAVENRLPRNYDIQRLRQHLGDRDYWTAWEQSIGNRLVLRKIYEHYRDLTASTDCPAPLAIYRVALDREDVDARVQRNADDVQRNIAAGYWYGLVLTRHANAQPTDETGILTRADPQTDKLGEPEAYKLHRLEILRSHPAPPRQLNEIRFEGIFRSQAVMQALHYTRGE